MFKKTKKQVTTNSKVEKLNIKELSNVIGGGSNTPPPQPSAPIIHKEMDATSPS
jgi:bacteriocin-like protein